MVAGLTAPTAGTICVQLQRAGQTVTATSTSQLAAVVGIVFQFPERHFLGETIMDVSCLSAVDVAKIGSKRWGNM
jgi:energy-coupling factor transporter ATP-binding protein EcfA2